MKIWNLLAPSISAASICSCGKFMMIPVATSIVTGIPTHIFTMIIENFAQIGSDKNGSGFAAEINPIFSIMALTGPASLSKFLMIRREMNCGTAMVITKIVRHNFLNRKPLVLMIKAKTIPKKKLVTVANTAQINVHDRTGKKVPAMRPLKMLPKLEKPTQSNKLLGGKWLWS